MVVLKMASSIFISQINLQHCKAAVEELNSRQEYDIVLVTEPYVHVNRVQSFKNVRQVAAAPNCSPRACIRSSVEFWTVGEFTDRDMATISVQTEKGTVYFTSVYLDIEETVKKESFIALLKRCENKNIPLVAGLDCNAHSPMWGAAEANGRGEELEEVILSHNLVVMNEGDVPTFQTIRASSIIDITLLNQAAVRNLQIDGWMVDGTESFSDHKYVTYQCNIFKPRKRMVRNLRKAKWNIFAAELQGSQWPEIMQDGSNLEEAAQAFQDRVKQALDKACPEREVGGGVRPNLWWNGALESKRQEVRRLADKRRGGPDRHQRYVEARREYTYMIGDAKRDAWRNFCSKAESAKDISNLMKMLEPSVVRNVNLLQSETGPTSTPEEALQVLLDVHFPEHKQAQDDVLEGLKLAPCEELIKFIDVMKVKEAIASFGDYKAAGPDELAPVVLKRLDQGSLDFITSLFQLSIQTGRVPRLWREMKVIFLPKAGKSDYTSPKAYRPITLSNFILKTLERILQWFILDNYVQEPLTSQHAYTKGRSTDSALSAFLDAVEGQVHRGHKALAVGLDCSGAFDRISFTSAREAMRNFNIPEALIGWYDTLLKNRRIFADLQGVNKTITPGKGSPQGGILSPLIWNLVMNTLLEKFKGSAVKAIGYADDILLVVQGVDSKTMGSIMQESLNLVSDWGKNHGLLFNPGKTEVVMFSRSRRPVLEPSLKLDGKQLQYSDTIKYLGLTVHKRLTWTDHVKTKVKKCSQLLNRVRRVVGRDWGLNPERLLWIYTAMVRPKVAYGALVWMHELADTARTSLHRLQRMILMGMSSTLRSTPTTAMEVIAGLEPLDMFIERQAASARIRTRWMPDTWDGVGHAAKKSSIRGHRAFWDKRLEKSCPRGTLVDKTAEVLCWTENDSIEKPFLKIFTDGSVNGNNGGFGWAACEEDYVVMEGKGKLHKSTVFQAEVAAIRGALLWLVSNPHRLKGEDYQLLSDSQAAVGAVTSRRIQSQMVKETVQLLREVRRETRVQVSWIKGHAECTGNEYADLLARSACEDIHATVVAVPVAIAVVKREIKNNTQLSWQRRWRRDTKCAQAKVIFPEVDMSRYGKVKKWPRHKIGKIFQVGTGHGMFAAHLAHWKPQLDVACKLCGEGADAPVHYWADCPALDNERYQAILQLELKNREEVIYHFFKSDKMTKVMEQNEGLL